MLQHGVWARNEFDDLGLQNPQGYRDQRAIRTQLGHSARILELHPDLAASPRDFGDRRAELQLAARAEKSLGQIRWNVLIRSVQPKQAIGVDGLLGTLLFDQRGDRDAILIRRVEALDVVRGRPPVPLILSPRRV